MFFELFIFSHDRSAYSVAGNMWTDPGNIKIAHMGFSSQCGDRKRRAQHSNSLILESGGKVLYYRKITKKGKGRNCSEGRLSKKFITGVF
jgi:hypothetical protein